MMNQNEASAVFGRATTTLQQRVIQKSEVVKVKQYRHFITAKLRFLSGRKLTQEKQTLKS